MRLETIKKRSDFLSAAARGKKFVTHNFILQMQQRPDSHPAGDGPRFGFTVTKKMGGAVTRNRIKRRLRTALREIAEKHALPGHDYVIISRHQALDCSYAELVRDMEFAFSRITTMKDKPAKTS